MNWLPSRQTMRKRVSELADLRAELAQVQSQLNMVTRNMALAKTPEQFEAISTTFDQLKAQETLLQAEIAEAESQTGQMRDAEAEVAGSNEHGPPVDGTRFWFRWPRPSWGSVPAHRRAGCSCGFSRCR